MTAPAQQPYLTRDLSAIDADALAALYQRSLRANPDGFIQDISYHGSIHDLLQGYQQDGGDAVFLLPDADSTQPLGIGGLRNAGDGVAEMCKLHLCVSAQGQGWGRLMAEHLMERASELGFSRVELHVTATQTAAIGLYHKLGFTVEKRGDWTGDINGEQITFDVIYMSRAVASASSAA
ncbi:MAG: hypothetical protein Alpg2KO_12770 [Alphaproteobacteria bacterium]